MNPTVVIVGRPNVGKSTLFNRLLGRRAALVSDIPGLTRDRREGTAFVRGHAVTLVDTAGLEDAAKGSIAARTRAQSEAALAKADLVLFVLDARDGVVPADAGFARAVRSRGAPTIVVANKCEGRTGGDGFYDAFQLGLGEPIAISAEHGEGLGELEEAIAASLGFNTAKVAGRDGAAPSAGEASQPMRIVITGRPNVGKSTLLNALVGEERMITGPEPGLTRDAVATDSTWGGRRVRLFDTAGLRRKARVREKAEQLAAGDALRAIRFAEVVIVVIDAERALEQQDLALCDLIAREGRALVIAVNKWDVVADKQRRLQRLRQEVAQRLAQVSGVPVVAISALAATGLEGLGRAVFESYAAWNRRVPTAELNRWLAAALERHAPPAPRGRRIKIRYMTQPSARPPTFVAFCSRPAHLPQAYLRYLTHGLRESFDLPGVPIRLKLQRSANPYEES
jgi:GTP-binding protein